jgi:hypothetical protein
VVSGLKGVDASAARKALGVSFVPGAHHDLGCSPTVLIRNLLAPSEVGAPGSGEKCGPCRTKPCSSPTTPQSATDRRSQDRYQTPSGVRRQPGRGGGGAGASDRQRLLLMAVRVDIVRERVEIYKRALATGGTIISAQVLLDERDRVHRLLQDFHPAASFADAGRRGAATRRRRPTGVSRQEATGPIVETVTCCGDTNRRLEPDASRSSRRTRPRPVRIPRAP